MDTGTLEKPRSTAHGAPRAYDDLPGPPRLPVLGNLLQIDTTRMHLQLEDWCAKYGTIYRLKLGKRRVIVIGEHELVSTVLRHRPRGFSRPTRLAAVWSEMGLANGVFA